MPSTSASVLKGGRPASVGGWLRLRAIVALLLALLGASCQTIGFYRQAAVGELNILEERKPTARLIAAAGTDAALRARLVEVNGMLQFAQTRLSLSPKKRYSSYVHLDAPYVVWNVFATPEFSTRPTQWCYPIVGCAAYRGYFRMNDARDLARRLISSQHDAIVGGVAAYSTLGWFDDPLLSTFINWPNPELAELIFHELAHGRVFIGGDTSFNEALATFVERRGVLEWLRSQGDDDTIKSTTARWADADRFVQYLLDWRAQLQRLYERPYNATARRLLKAEMMSEIANCYATHRDQLGGGASDWFFREPVNNARLVPFAAYHELVAGFEGLFADSDEDWPTFFSRADGMKRMDADARVAELNRLASVYRPQLTQSIAAPPIRCLSLDYDDAD
jgi:predicted aminopeptidase